MYPAQSPSFWQMVALGIPAFRSEMMVVREEVHMVLHCTQSQCSALRSGVRRTWVMSVPLRVPHLARMVD